MTAKRFNTGKIDFTITPVDALIEEAKVWSMGEKKYGRNNWEKLWGDKTVEVVMQSALRHSNAILQGEFIDEESGLQHAAHVRCNMAMLIRYFNEHKFKGKTKEELEARSKELVGSGTEEDVDYIPHDTNPLKVGTYIVYKINPKHLYRKCVYRDNNSTIFNNTLSRFEYRIEGYDYGES